MGLIFAASLAALLWRLWELQVHQGEDHLRAIQRQSVRRIRLSPERGRMFAADGTVLVDNRPVYDVVFHVSEMRRPGPRRNTLNHIMEQGLRLSKRLQKTSRLSPDVIERHLKFFPAMPLPVFTDLSPRELILTAELMPPIAGAEIVTRVLRRYPLPGVATHCLGFTGYRRPPEGPESKRYSYVEQEPRGRNGLELFYDNELAGEGGSMLVRVDMLGYVHEEIGVRKPPGHGKDLRLTLESKAQVAADRLLTGRRGAIVVLNARTGAVLAMASAPTYNLAELSAVTYSGLLADTANAPLLNRAISANYTPGSIVKPLIGLAAMEAGVVTPEQTLHCGGAFYFGPTAIRCWNRWGHGDVALVDALRGSCNPYFLTVGVECGLARLIPVLAGAGIGARPEVDLPSAGAGLLPDRGYAQEHWGRGWIAVDTAYVSIGQGAIALSPLQAAMYVAAIGNGGVVYRPHLVGSIRLVDGGGWLETVPAMAHRLPVRAENLRVVQQGMEEAVGSTGATAAAARTPAISLAGKTGTAQVSEHGVRYSNAWFIGYGPIEAPLYAIAVVIERGESGGKTAAPLARELFETWLEAGH
ncbi:MAG: penicillin-binding protein 2 [Lentisphaerae bacterium RIFOXYA12_64_32]|nr:MAG: penicillin-binding protein 2 [Lentisphaerae bacterium RIFOXYA12_64_32]